MHVGLAGSPVMITGRLLATFPGRIKTIIVKTPVPCPMMKVKKY
jgi:hypothetical protein